MNDEITLNGLQVTHLNDVTQGMVETSPKICGNWRKSWVMQLRRKPGSFTLPRGFRLKKSKPKTEYR
ncbi:hypothetical protein [Marinobacter lutaoensis]|uniref:hypothetical protein n=1 Tax=Marinobacter lutaoensis TaxID=135739 RepID=UPI00111566DB|nr:hypothetical protein [Marinobacter lutaoensis]